MTTTTKIDIYDVLGTWRDSCEYGQLADLLPMFTVLFGAVTWRVRDDQAQAVVSFGEWLETV